MPPKERSSAPARPLRVVCDTNVVVSALVFLAGRPGWLRQAWAAGTVVPVVSKETVAELVRVLSYPKLRLEAEETKSLLALYMERAEALDAVTSAARLPACRDEDDRAFLRLAYAARVDALVTGDADLLAVAAQSKIPILAPDALKQRLQHD
ncbi:MAG: putative toxin-antitoxin system toxin component, PIN family [Betaproteobacteria bacterium RIFCSPLOWO2_12_FULL_66_14]|nr:MAG: putative toxin-antitoxin system toxin component, PIN family [Betaproteobacteria bacterium RIFCSPLOWO2_12_FULL_66_14]